MNDVPKKETIMKVTRKKLMAAPMGCDAISNFHPLEAISYQKAEFFKRPAMRLFCASVALGLTLWASGLAVAAQPYKLDVGGNVNITGAYHVNGVPISATSNWSQAGNDISYTTGNVGIGTISPTARLDVRSANGNILDLYGTGTHVRHYNAAASQKMYEYLDDTNNTYAFYSYPLVAPIMSLAYVSGHVGIGTTDPSSGKLTIDGGNATGVWITTNSGNGVSATSISGTGVAGYSTSGPAVNGYSTNASGVKAGSTSSFGLHATSVSGTGVYGFSSNGYGVAGYSTSNYAVYGKSISNYAGYFEGNVYVTGNLTAANFPNSSDARLKENVQSLGYGLPELMRLRPVSWSWIDQTQKQLPMGLIAQDVDEVIPELVLRDPDPTRPLGLNYMGLLPVMIKAMQEQQDIITALKAENTSLDARLKALEQRLHQ
jgi:hypothetical protein